MKLPPNVHRKGPTLYLIKPVNGKRKWIRLCLASAPEKDIYQALWKLQRKNFNSLGQVMVDYEKTRITSLKPVTQREYQRIIDRQLRPVFGHVLPDDVTPQDIAVFLEERDRAGHGVAGNREIAVLSSIYNHGMRLRACSTNPCYGVRRNRERPRTFYVSDESLRLALRNAQKSLRYLLWAGYLTGLRQQDLRNLTRENITPEGIEVVQSKDGKHELRLWTDSLRKVVRRALARSRSPYVFTNERGEHMTLSAIQSAMQTLKRRTGIEWRFHDIRAKADSDHETGFGLMRRYNRANRMRAVK